MFITIIYRCLWISMLHIVFLVFWSIYKYTSHQYFVQFSWMSTNVQCQCFALGQLLVFLNISKCTVSMFYTGTVCSVLWYMRMHSIHVLHWNSLQHSLLSENAQFQWFAPEQFAVFFSIQECTVSMFCTGTVFNGLLKHLKLRFKAFPFVSKYT